MMGEEELRELGDDITANGLHEKIKVILRDDWVVIDGRNRLDAMEIAGVPIFQADNRPNFDNFEEVVLEDDEIFTYVVSANIHRRHLFPEKRVELLREIIKATPTKSSRQIANETGFSNVTVSKERKKLEQSGDVLTGLHVTDTKGRQQQAHKPKPEPPPLPDVETMSLKEIQEELRSPPALATPERKQQLWQRLDALNKSSVPAPTPSVDAPYKRAEREARAAPPASSTGTTTEEVLEIAWKVRREITRNDVVTLCNWVIEVANRMVAIGGGR